MHKCIPYGFSRCGHQIYPFHRHYPARKNGQLNISELARVCNISRTTAYKYKALLEV